MNKLYIYICMCVCVCVNALKILFLKFDEQQLIVDLVETYRAKS